jgi:hypothetical protein
MWVHLLRIKAHQRFQEDELAIQHERETVKAHTKEFLERARPPRPDAEAMRLRNFLSFILFRASANRKASQQHSERAEVTNPETLDGFVSMEPTPEALVTEKATIEAGWAKLAKEMRRSGRFDDGTIQRTIAGLREGVPVAHVALAIGEFPQVLHRYVAKARAA